MTYEVFVHLPDEFLQIIVDLFNNCLRKKVTPECWGKGLTIPVPKPSGGYRPITLLESTRKFFEAMLKDRIESKVNLAEEQGGFRKGRCTLMQNLNLEFALSDMIKPGRCAVFLYITKAYDNLDRELLWEKLHKKHAQIVEYIPILRSMHDYNSTSVIWNGKKSEVVRLNKEVAQGSILSPLLFNLFINDLPEYIKKSRE